VGPLCAARDGIIDHDLTGGPKKVHANIVSRLNAGSGGVQGWSLAIGLQGGGDILSATTAGTIVDPEDKGGLYSNGFNKTGVYYSGTPVVKAALSGVVLSLTEGVTLPLEGTQSVLVLEVSGPEGSTSVLNPIDGIRGFENPILNVLTVGGDSKVACNTRTARIEIRHLARDDFIRGNANGDEGLDIADPVWILNELFHDGPPSACADASDSNDDGRVDISDAVHLIRYLFLTGGAPLQPFPECGIDDTEDEIGCVGESSPC
jgi:hypothetical protein